VHLSYTDRVAFRDVYGFASGEGRVSVDGYRWTPRGRSSKTVLIYMHPASTMHTLPFPAAMVGAGAHVLLAGGRYNRNDAPLIMENVVRDYAAYVRHVKDVWGYETVVLAGWSGGGSLTAFYQSQATNPAISQTPAGDPVDLSGLVAGDALIFHAAHLSRAEVLRDCIDPSVLDEANPSVRDPELDLYDPRNSNRPPYNPDYLAYFRAAQCERIRRRTAYAKEMLHTLRKKGGRELERAIVTHRTLADPRFLDGTIDPNDRQIGRCFLGDPEASNNSPAGIARFSTLRAWLSQWSHDDTNAHALKHATNITVPLLAIENSADDAVPQPHIKKFFDAAASPNKTYRRIEGANHYYGGQADLCTQAAGLVMSWLEENALVD
jgi:dienelactone hydrolase